MEVRSHVADHVAPLGGEGTVLHWLGCWSGLKGVLAIQERHLSNIPTKLLQLSHDIRHEIVSLRRRRRGKAIKTDLGRLGIHFF